jgi:hypothetical protein
MPCPVRSRGHPRNRDAVIEAQHEFEAARHHAAPPLDDPNHGRWLYGHEVDEGDGAVRRLEQSLQHQRVAAILARDPGHDAGGAIRHSPFRRVPSRAAKHAALSKRGRHNQSIEPCLETSAAEWQSPISA